MLNKKIIGVLALQGDFSAHQAAFMELGADTRVIRKPSQLQQLAGLVIPGGESSALQRLMAPLGMQQAIVDFVQSGGGLFGTCAGMILAAKHIFERADGDALSGLDLVDCDILRNAYGRQLQSFCGSGSVSADFNGMAGMGRDDALQLPFIRAPKVLRVGDQVQVLARHENIPVLLRQQRCLLASFHPELSQQRAVQRYFLSMLAED